MDRESFQGFQDVAYKHAGIFLRDGKEALVQARIAKRIRELGLPGERDYLDLLRGEGAEEEIVRFLDAISTNYTTFFREPDHIEELVRDVTRLRDGGQRKFRIWSAASSTGEEPYSIAMALAGALEGCDWLILATDISTRVLARAKAGVYGENEVAAIPEPLRRRWLEPAGAAVAGEPAWAVRAELKERVVYRRLNLATPPFPMKGPLDGILCRNVMIYFDQHVRQGLVSEAARLLRPGCLFMVGHSETLNGLKTPLKALRPSVYRLPG
ncbi:CheR family methyltransferase [Anaeromyxobacter paludicola]|uniref:protein-glutamate O-methyltransferase n=1 Tax=Anaeromyxobacter paludicola TaxID=2918171 RepID=A0ABM7X826_9BACT|nr:CheR family methyltransferase [Anaeromyxobacter paludicola]BDG07986.1 chemotaxis protein methyltransferase [Anaeromyxobacter paludicola]